MSALSRALGCWLLAIALATATSTLRAAPVTEADALQFVTKFKVGSNLLTMALQAARSTQTYAMLASKLGQDRAQALVTQELRCLLPEYQPQWDNNLATFYAEVFTSDQLISVAQQGRSSKYFADIAAQQGAVGKRMQSKSSSLLSSYVSGALTNVMRNRP